MNVLRQDLSVFPHTSCKSLTFTTAEKVPNKSCRQVYNTHTHTHTHSICPIYLTHSSHSFQDN